MHDAAHLLLLDTELSGNRRLATARNLLEFHDYRAHIGLGKLRVVVVLAALAILFPSASACPIPRVVSFRSEVEMGWVAAWGVVAVVEDELAIRNRLSVLDFPRNPVGLDPSSARVMQRSTVKKAVAIAVHGASPFPAFVWAPLVHLRPQTFGWWARLWSIWHPTTIPQDLLVTPYSSQTAYQSQIWPVPVGM